jgi:hypothetical protein
MTTSGLIRNDTAPQNSLSTTTIHSKRTDQEHVVVFPFLVGLGAILNVFESRVVNHVDNQT